MNAVEPRLDYLRGDVALKSHNARTIAALASNPGCARRAVLDAAGIDKQRLGAHLGFPALFGQSQSALGRGNAFEAQVKANGCAELLTLLRDHLELPVAEASYDNLDDVGGNTGLPVRHARTRSLLARAFGSPSEAGTLFDHPLLRLEVGGRPVYLEPDVIAFQLGGKFYVVEVKSFPVIDGQADGGKVAAAVIQSAVYVLALGGLLAEFGSGPDAVSSEVVLVCPENFSNKPTAALLDVRKQLTVLRRQLSRLARIESLVEALPAGLTFSLDLDSAGVPGRPPQAVADAVREVDARYAPECLASCELCFFCRAESRGRTESLGREVRDELGAIDEIGVVLGLADAFDSRGDGPSGELPGACAVSRRDIAWQMGRPGPTVGRPRTTTELRPKSQSPASPLTWARISYRRNGAVAPLTYLHLQADAETRCRCPRFDIRSVVCATVLTMASRRAQHRSSVNRPTWPDVARQVIADWGACCRLTFVIVTVGLVCRLDSAVIERTATIVVSLADMHH